jgi:hypothetical protein
LGQWEDFKERNRVLRKNMQSLGYSKEQVDSLLRALYSEEVTEQEYKETKYEVRLSGYSKVSEAGDFLSWNTAITEMTIGDDNIIPVLPILVYRGLVDPFGKIKAFDLTLPALADDNVRSKMSENEYEWLVNAIEHVVTLPGPLPLNKVRTGDVLLRSEITDSIGAIVREVPELMWLSDSEEAGAAEHVVQGWTHLNTNSVLLTTVNYFDEFENKRTGDQIQVGISGFSLFDLSSFQLLYRKQLMLIESVTARIGKVIARNLLVYKAKQVRRD